MKVDYKSIWVAIVVGVLSGIAAYASYGPVRQFGFLVVLPLPTLFYFILYPGTVFGAMSGLYFAQITKEKKKSTAVYKILLWTIGSLFSFSVAILSLFFSPLQNEMITAGLVGTLTLLGTFFVVYRRFDAKIYGLILAIGTLVPAAMYGGYLDMYYQDTFLEPHWLVLFTLWQTFMVVTFSHLLIKRK